MKLLPEVSESSKRVRAFWDKAMKDHLAPRWREWTRAHFRPRMERAAGFAVGLFYPKVVPRLTLLDYTCARHFDGPMVSFDQASLRLYCLDSKEAVTITIQGDQVQRLHHFICQAQRSADDHLPHV